MFLRGAKRQGMHGSLHLYAVAGRGPLLVGRWAQRFLQSSVISFEVLRGVLRCPLSSFYLDFFWFAVPMCHVIFLREVEGDWYLQLCKSLLLLSAGYWGSGAEARGRI